MRSNLFGENLESTSDERMALQNPRLLRVRLDGISPKVLTATLRRLETAGMLTRTVYPAVPLHVEYELTELGVDAAGPLDTLRLWVEDNLDRFPHR